MKKGQKKKLETTLSELNKQWDMMLHTYASLEAQAAGIADDIAYNSHDIDDGLASGIFSLADLEQQVPWVGAIAQAKRKAYPGIERRVLEQETIRDVMGIYVLDVLATSRDRLSMLSPKEPDDIRHAKHQMVAMSDDMRRKDRVLRDFLWANFYRSPNVSRMRTKIFRCVQDLFTCFMENKRCLPVEWMARIDQVPKGYSAKNWHARVVADYIASMTDRLAMLEHAQIFDLKQELRG